MDARTFAVIGAEWMSTSEIYAKAKRREKLKLQRNTMCMRLARLLSDGLLERRPSQSNAKEYDYRRIAATRNKPRGSRAAPTAETEQRTEPAVQ